MAQYKVPQDVEAEDKLIGPFSFRQFGYLFGVAIGGVILFFLFAKSPIFVAGMFAILLLPPMIVLAALALPLKKDQPMETYLLAMVRFFFKPRLRLWAPDGSMALVDITAPKTLDEPRTKSFGSEEADSRLDYLANLMDSRGWSSKGVAIAPAPMIAFSDDTEDVLDENASTSRSFDQLLEQEEQAHRQAVVQQMKQPQAAKDEPEQAADDTTVPQFNPYPTMHQHVLSPSGEHKPKPTKHTSTPKTSAKPPQSEPVTEETASAKSVSPDIMRLAENKDLSISAIAHEANRLKSKKLSEDEVVISLR